MKEEEKIIIRIRDNKDYITVRLEESRPEFYEPFPWQKMILDDFKTYNLKQIVRTLLEPTDILHFTLTCAEVGFCWHHLLAYNNIRHLRDVSIVGHNLRKRGIDEFKKFMKTRTQLPKDPDKPISW